jgi:hypothetical protein
LKAGNVNVQGWAEAVVNPTLHKTVQRVLDVCRDATTAIIRKAQAKGEIDPAIDAHAFANILLSLYYGLELQLALDPLTDVDSYAQTVKRLLGAARQG